MSDNPLLANHKVCQITVADPGFPRDGGANPWGEGEEQ